MKATMTANEALKAVAVVLCDVSADIIKLGEDLDEVNKTLNKSKIEDGEKKRAKSQKDAFELAVKSASVIAARLREIHGQLSVIPAECVVELSPVEMTLLSYVGQK